MASYHNLEGDRKLTKTRCRGGLDTTGARVLGYSRKRCGVEGEGPGREECVMSKQMNCCVSVLLMIWTKYQGVW